MVHVFLIVEEILRIIEIVYVKDRGSVFFSFPHVNKKNITHKIKCK